MLSRPDARYRLFPSSARFKLRRPLEYEGLSAQETWENLGFSKFGPSKGRKVLFNSPRPSPELDRSLIRLSSRTAVTLPDGSVLVCSGCFLDPTGNQKLSTIFRRFGMADPWQSIADFNQDGRSILPPYTQALAGSNEASAIREARRLGLALLRGMLGFRPSKPSSSIPYGRRHDLRDHLSSLFKRFASRVPASETRALASDRALSSYVFVKRKGPSPAKIGGEYAVCCPA